MPSELTPISLNAVSIQTAADSLYLENLMHTMSENTARAYGVQWKQFAAWCQAAGLSALPALPDTVALYIRHLQDDGHKYSTIAQAVAAIVKAHKMRDLPTPKNERVSVALKAAARAIGTAPAQKSAMTLPILQTILNGIGGDSLKDKRDSALLALGFMGAFRRSELAALKVSDIEQKTDQTGRPLLIVTVARSKTDQTGAGMCKAIFTGQGQVNAVALLLDWLKAAGLVDNMPVFPSIKKGGRVQAYPMRGADIANVVKDRAAAVGIVLNLSGHSMRRGFVTSAIEAGANERSIMNQTGHKSVTTLRRYFERHAVETDNAAALF